MTADETGEAAQRVYTIGHSTHSMEVFLELLAPHRIELLADVRSYPASRRWPQFNREALAESVVQTGIEYRWLRSLGGRRHAKTATTLHPAWKVAAFRAYAEYADTAEWQAGLREFVALATGRRATLMCAEGLWWRCHRRIIADHLTVMRPHGWSVQHILPDGKLAAHVLPEFARVRDGRLFYDDGQPQLGT